MHQAMYGVLLVVLVAGTVAAKQAVHVYSGRKQENGTGFVVMSIFLTVAVVFFDQWGGGVYSGIINVVIIVAGMAVHDPLQPLSTCLIWGRSTLAELDRSDAES